VDFEINGCSVIRENSIVVIGEVNSSELYQLKKFESLEISQKVHCHKNVFHQKHRKFSHQALKAVDNLMKPNRDWMKFEKCDIEELYDVKKVDCLSQKLKFVGCSRDNKGFSSKSQNADIDKKMNSLATFDLVQNQEDDQEVPANSQNDFVNSDPSRDSNFYLSPGTSSDVNRVQDSSGHELEEEPVTNTQRGEVNLDPQKSSDNLEDHSRLVAVFADVLEFDCKAMKRNENSVKLPDNPEEIESKLINLKDVPDGMKLFKIEHSLYQKEVSFNFNLRYVDSFILASPGGAEIRNVENVKKKFSEHQNNSVAVCEEFESRIKSTGNFGQCSE
jgi:hypothetical protein